MNIQAESATMGLWSYAYDTRGLLLSQDDARSQRTCLYYDTLDRLTGKYYTTSATNCPTSPGMNVSNSYDGSLYTQPFDGSSLPSGWSSQGTGVSVSGGALNLTGNGVDWTTNASRSSATVSDGQAVRLSFKLSATSAQATYFLRTGTWGQSSYRKWGLYISGGTIYRESYIGTSYEQVALLATKANTWYEAVLVMDARDSYRVVVWERDNPSVWAQNSAAHSDWGSLTWQFYTQARTGVSNLDYYAEQVAYATGQRTLTNDSSGSTAWAYDLRGRPIKETKAITGGGTFVTHNDAAASSRYDSADMAAALTCPGGNNNGPA